MDHSITIAIHQPNFFPWFGFFYKMNHADLFVLLDNVEHTKKSFTRRVYIPHPFYLERLEYLRVPLNKHSDFSLINTLIVQDPNWKVSLRKQIEQTFVKAPYFAQGKAVFEDCIRHVPDTQNLSQINIAIIESLVKTLEISSRLVVSSSVGLELDTLRSKNLQYCIHFDARVYLSGVGGANYQDDRLYAAHNIALRYATPKAIFESNAIAPLLQKQSILSWFMYYPKEEIIRLLADTSGIQ